MLLAQSGAQMQAATYTELILLIGSDVTLHRHWSLVKELDFAFALRHESGLEWP